MQGRHAAARSDAPVLDVIIDSFNYGRFLSPAIESALAQDYDRLRVTVVADGSTDDSVQVARSFGDRIAVIVKPNGGQASAFNAGFAATSGDLVCFLDADDVLWPGFASRAVAALEGAPGAAKVAFRAGVVAIDGMPLGRVEPDAASPLPSGDLRHSTLSHPFDLAWSPLHAQVFQRWALERVMPVPEHSYPCTGADWYVSHATSLVGTVVAVDEAVVGYRLHGGNGYLVSTDVLDLDQLRTSIPYAAETRRHLRRLAGELGLALPVGDGVSSSEAARALVSRRLDPTNHPIAGDRASHWWLSGVRSAARREDIPVRTRIALAAWFTLAAVAPRRALPWIATQFFVPQQRGILRRLSSRPR